MIQLFSFSQLPLISIALLIFFGLMHYIILPYYKVCSFKRPHISTYFYPILGIYNLYKLSMKQTGDVLSSIKESSWKSPNTKIFVSNLGKKVVIGLRDPQYIKEFFQNHGNYQKDGPPIKFLRPLLGKGLFLTEGETWKHHRKIISHSFHYESLRQNIEIVQKTAREFLSSVKHQDFEDYSVFPKMQEITGEVVGRVFFGEQFHRYQVDGRPLTLALAELISDLNKTSITPAGVFIGPQVLNFSFFPKFKELKSQIRKIRRICMQIVEDRKAQGQAGYDLLSTFFATQKSESVEQRISDEEIVDEFLTFFAAGMDTTAHLIGMAIYMLTQYPEYIEQLRKERDEVYPKGEEKVTAEALQSMDKLHNFLKETLRFYTPGPSTFLRIAKKDHKILDLDVKKGTLVKPDFLSLFFSEKYFTEPKIFNPDRWSNTDNKMDPYAFTPFSAGPRSCIGQNLAIIESKVILSEFLNRFDFKLKEGFRLKMVVRFSYGPVDELLLKLSERGGQK